MLLKHERFFMSPQEELIQHLHPILSFLSTNPISSTLEEKLKAHFPLQSEYMQTIKRLCVTGSINGWLCPRKGQDLTYGRLIKTSPETFDFGIDTVTMSSVGPGHTHPHGEIDLCFTMDGHPTFDNNPEGWTIYEPNTWHIPTVTGGTMVILYFLPNGAISFGPKPT